MKQLLAWLFIVALFGYAFFLIKSGWLNCTTNPAMLTCARSEHVQDN